MGCRGACWGDGCVRKGGGGEGVFRWGEVKMCVWWRVGWGRVCSGVFIIPPPPTHTHTSCLLTVA